MTMVYARIADRTVAEEYFAVSEKVEALYDHSASLPAEAEGTEMRKLRGEMHRRMLGNGYCAPARWPPMYFLRRTRGQAAAPYRSETRRTRAPT